MSRPGPSAARVTLPAVLVRDFEHGTDVDQVLLVREASRRARRDGAEFLKLSLGDRTGGIAATVFDDVAQAEELCRAGSPVHVIGRYEVHQRWGAQILIRALRAPLDGTFDPAQLADGPPRAVDQMEADLRELVSTVRHPHLRRLLDVFFGERSETWALYRIAPAAKHYHQAYLHGLLEHSLTVAQAVSAISATFPGIDRDIAVTGALLHDIGKLEAYTCDAPIDMTDAGRLQGEIPLGYYRVRRVIEDLAGFPEAAAESVLHIILSHHGALAHGSPVVPCTREATLVHMIDNLGGRLGSFDRPGKGLGAGGGGAAAGSARSTAWRRAWRPARRGRRSTARWARAPTSARRRSPPRTAGPRRARRSPRPKPPSRGTRARRRAPATAGPRARCRGCPSSRAPPRRCARGTRRGAPRPASRRRGPGARRSPGRWSAGCAGRAPDAPAARADRPASRCRSGSSVVAGGVEGDLTALEGDGDRVDAVAGLELADDVAHVRPDRLDRDADLVADRLGGHALSHEVHDLPLAGRELRHVGRRARGEQDPVQPRVDVRAAVGHAFDRRHQLVHRTGLQRVAARAAVEAVVEQLGVGVARVEDHAELGTAGQQLAREVDPAAVGQLDVDDRDVGLGVVDEVDAGRHVARGAHDLEPAVLQQRDKALA